MGEPGGRMGFPLSQRSIRERTPKRNWTRSLRRSAKRRPIAWMTSPSCTSPMRSIWNPTFPVVRKSWANVRTSPAGTKTYSGRSPLNFWEYDGVISSPSTTRHVCCRGKVRQRAAHRRSAPAAAPGYRSGPVGAGLLADDVRERNLPAASPPKSMGRFRFSGLYAVKPENRKPRNTRHFRGLAG